MILQLDPAIPVNTPLGKGQAIFIMDYGMHQNSCWVVALSHNGSVKHFDSNDVFLEPNHTYRMNTPHLDHSLPQQSGAPANTLKN